MVSTSSCDSCISVEVAEIKIKRKRRKRKGGMAEKKQVRKLRIYFYTGFHFQNDD
jgi:hypothetical protein